MKYKFLRISLTIFFFIFLLACRQKENGENLIYSFVFEELDPKVEATIDQEKLFIEAWVHETVDVTALTPTIKVSDDAIVEPPSGFQQNFTSLVPYTVAAENGNIRTYTVKVNKYYNNLISFSFSNAVGSIIIRNDSILAQFPFATDITNLIPVFILPPKATISPASGIAYDFTEPKKFTVTSENGIDHVYTVVVTKEPGDDANTIFAVEFPELYQTGAFSGKNITFNLPFGSDLSSILVKTTISSKATINPANLTRVDFSNPRIFTVTSQSGIPNEYTVTVQVDPQENSLRGVWLTNVASEALYSLDNIRKAVQLIDALNFNAIFVVTWNKNLTPYPSQVLKNNVLSGVETEMFPGRDALAELITEAHARNIKVFAWFEYGFASQYGLGTSNGRGSVLQAHPEWESRDKNGNLAERHGFYWMNGFHPEVQQFMIDMMVELINNYDIDGIQGDDRLPAMPVNSGYDDYTVNLYKSENGGQEPPTNEFSEIWKQWRAKKMTDYAGKLYDAVKAANPNCIVAHAPHPHTYGYDEYLQNWPAWIQNGKVDVIMPQLYRNEDISAYTWLLNSNVNYVNQVGNLSMLNPGLLLLVGGSLSSEKYVIDMVRANRQKGVKGECFFYYEGLKARENAFKILYPGKSIFPDFLKK